MRDILFKAKQIDNSEWIEGGYVHRTDYYGAKYDKHYIIDGTDTDGEGYGEHYLVDVTTICQYTGLTDKNGNKIWENDVVFVTDDDGNSGQVDTGVGEIAFLEGLWYISGSVQNSLYDLDKCFQIKVIGNIFDNAELLEG